MVLKDSSNKTSTDPPLMDGEEQIYPSNSDDEKEKSGSCKSRMQEIFQSENRWKENIHQLEEIIVSRGMHIFNQDSFCGVLKQENALDILFKLFDWDNCGKISQEKFVDQTRYGLKEKPGSREWVELVDVLAFVICGEDGDISEENFHKIFLSKGVLRKLYKYTEKNNEGCTTKKGIMDLIANLTSARPREGLNKESLDHLERMFRESIGEKQELTFEDFTKIVHSRNPFFAERVFNVFDRDNNGSVSLTEFLDSMHQFTGKSPNDKIQFVFRIYDLDGDGLIRRDELEKVMKACMEENGMKFSNEQIEDLTLALFEDADTENRGEITFEDLKAQLEKHPGLLENLSISIDRWLLPPQPQTKKKYGLPYQLTKPYLRNNYVYLGFLLLFTIVNLAMFFDRLTTILEDTPEKALLPYAVKNGYYALARACGHCLNFNCMFILFMVLRYSLTFLRSKGFSSYLPLDQNIYFHKLCGFVIFVQSVVHTVMHLINFPSYVVTEKALNPLNYTSVDWFFTSKPLAFGLVKGWANPTGFILMIILIIMVVCSLPFVRKSGKFEVFYWTHLLYVLFFGLTILHGPHFYKWFIVPGTIFIIEKVYRTVKMTMSKSYISSGILLPSKVTHLVVQKPPGFHFHPGDYVFVNIPLIAKYEWHPITISSAPEQEEAVWLHIRAVGEWTNRLYEYFEKQQKMCTKSHIHMAKTKDETRIMIEGAKVTTQSDEDNKNGVVNLSYNSDGEDKNEISSSEENEDGEKCPVKPVRSKRSVDKTQSTPGFGIQTKRKENLLIMRNNFRTNSDKSFERKMAFATNRAAMQSFKYMRRKPKIVTLEMPEDIPIEGDEGDAQKNIIKEEEEVIESGPKNTIVRLTSGRVFRSSKHKKEVSLDSRRARRQSRMKEAESIGTCSVGQPLKIYFDGAYGAPSSHIFRAQHAVLIGTGIGVTPFASILQSIMQRYLKTRQTCPNCAHTWSSEIMSVMNLKKVDFYWINRDQRSFEWFVNLLSQLEIEQAEQGGELERFLDMHMYITSALQKTDMKAVGLQLAMDLLHEKDKRDLITGLKTRTNAGRPNWDKVFKQLRNQQKGKITVFYCGPPALGRILKYKCGDYGFDFRKENF